MKQAMELEVAAVTADATATTVRGSGTTSMMPSLGCSPPVDEDPGGTKPI